MLRLIPPKMVVHLSCQMRFQTCCQKVARCRQATTTATLLSHRAQCHPDPYSCLSFSSHTHTCTCAHTVHEWMVLCVLCVCPFRLPQHQRHRRRRRRQPLPVPLTVAVEPRRQLIVGLGASGPLSLGAWRRSHLVMPVFVARVLANGVAGSDAEGPRRRRRCWGICHRLCVYVCTFCATVRMRA